MSLRPARWRQPERLRTQYLHDSKNAPKLKCIIIEDGLASNGPHIQDLISLNFEFLYGAKPGDHTFLVDNFMKMDELGY